MAASLEHIKNSEIPLYSLNGVITKGKVVSIYDGDTCTIVLDISTDKQPSPFVSFCNTLLPCCGVQSSNVLQKFKCRLNGLDTPEMKPSLKNSDRVAEIHAAHKSRNRLMQMITNCSFDQTKELSKKECQDLVDQNTKIITVECLEFDKYGRLLVKLFYGYNVTANNTLIAEGLAKPYDGGTKDITEY